MATKKQILTNLREFSAEDLAKAINDGTITIYELSKTGLLTPRMRKRIGECLENLKLGVGSDTPAVSPDQPLNQPLADSFDQPLAESYNQPLADVLPPPQAAEPYVATPPAPPVVPPAPPVPPTMQHIPSCGPATSPRVAPAAPAAAGGTTMFQHPFSFKGRCRRTEYGIAFIISSVWAVLFAVMPPTIAYIAGSEDVAIVVMLLLFVVGVFVCWQFVTECAKRCHDTGHSGWFQFIPLFNLVLLFLEGEKTPNRYGPAPK